MDVSAWFAGKSFSTDWTSKRFPLWLELLEPLREHEVSILEIGSWEGRSALFFLNYLPKSKIVCVEPFAGGDEHKLNPAIAHYLAAVENRFDSNLADFVGRVEKVKGRSHDMLPEMAIDRRRFNLTYIDGSHRAADVYSDAILSWPMIERGGIVIFDDYLWGMHLDARQRPQMGVDQALADLEGQYKCIHSSYQIVVEKL